MFSRAQTIATAAMLSVALVLFNSAPRAASISESGVQTADAPNYYKRHAEGWYWYQDPVEEEELPAEPLPLPEPAPAPEPEKKEEAKLEPPPPPPAPELEPVKPLSAAWVRDMLPKYRDLMWSEPTPENVKAYFILQRFAMDRSQKVAEVAQQVMIGNPLLDETFRRPTSSFAVSAVDRTAGKKMDEVIRKIAKKAGIFFFFKSDCRFCEAEAPLIGLLEKNDGFDVLAISIDGGALQSYQFQNTRMNGGHAQQLGVTATPALFLVSGAGEFEALGQGLLALPELRRRIVIAAARRGWIDESDVEATKPIINPDTQIDLSKELPQLLLAAQNPAMAWGDPKAYEAAVNTDEAVTMSLMDKDGFIQPNKLLSLFDGAETGGQYNPQEITPENLNAEETQVE